MAGALTRLRVGLGLAALGPALLALPGDPAAAQVPPPPGPVVVSPSAALEPLRLYDVDVAVELEWRRDTSQFDPANGSRRRDVEDRLRQILDVRTGGFIGHPNLLELDLGGRFWLEQRWLDLDSADRTERIDQGLIDWDLSGLFLRETRLPFTIYTRQNTSDVDRQFGGTLENTFAETGVRLNLRHSTLPTNVQIFRREIEQEDRALGQDFTIDQDTIEADGRVEMGPAQRLAWDLAYDDVEQAGQLRVPRSFDRFQADVTHTLEFGSRRQHSLRTPLRLFDQTGDLEQRLIRVDPRLRLEHSDTLATWYDYTFSFNDQPAQEQRTNRATANFQHQLFESLTTIGTAGFELFDVPTDDFDSDEVFGSLESDYVKRVPYGRLNLGLQALGSRVDQSERGTPLAVTDDLRIFDAADLIVIEGRNIVPGSIDITDVAGVIVYSEGVDFSVLGFPDRVEIRRIPGGNISPGQAVLVDYVIGPQPGGTTDTLGLGAEFRYTFEEGVLNGLSLYTQLFDQDERRSLASEDFPENDFTDVRYGLEYTRGPLFLRAEQQHRDSTLSPFDAVRVEGRYTNPLGRGSALVLGALFQEIDRSDDDIRTSTTTFSGQWNQRIDERLRVSLLLQYQLTDDSVSIDGSAFEQQLDVSWRYRQTEIYAQVRTSINDTTADDTEFQRFIVGLRREF